MDEKSSSPANARSSMIGSAFAVVKNYFTPERASVAKTNQSVGITPLARSFATLALDDSSHDSTGSFRTTFSQQDDSFQSTASHVDLLDEYNETSEGVSDQTVVVEETLLDSSVSSLDINCTVNDGIEDSVILVSDSNDSPQIVFANVAKKEVKIKKNVHDISDNLSSEYHGNIEEILEDVNDDGSLLSDMLQKHDSPDIATDDDKRNENNQTEESCIGVIANKAESTINSDDGTSLIHISTVSKESVSKISTPVALKSESVNNSYDFSQIVFENVAKKDVHDISANLSKEYHKNIEDILEDVNDDGSLLSDILLKHDSPDIASVNDKRNENNPTEESSIHAIDNKEESPINTDDGTSLINISTVSKESVINISTPVALKSESVNNFSPIFIPEIVVTQVSNNDVSPVFDESNSFDTVESCDKSPNVINNTQIITNGQENSGSVDLHKANDIVSTIKHESCNDENIKVDLTMNESKVINEELVEDTITEQFNIMPVDNMSKELPSELAEIEKCTEITLNEISQLTDAMPLNITSDPANNEGKVNDTNDSLNTTNPLIASANVDALLNITNALNNTNITSSGEVESSDELAVSELAAAEDPNLLSNTAKDLLNTTEALMVQENVHSLLLNSTESLGMPENTANIDTSLSDINKIEVSGDAVENITSLSLETYNNDGLLNYAEAEESTDVLSNVSNEATTVSLNSVNDVNKLQISNETPESSNAVMNETHEVLLPTTAAVSSISSETVEGTIQHQVSTEDSANDAINVSHELINSKESLNSTSPSELVELETSIYDTNEHLNTTVPLVTSETADSLLINNEPITTTVPLVISITEDSSLNVTNELLNTTVPLVTSETADSLINNAPLNTTVPLVTSIPKDSSLNVTLSLNTTVPLVPLENADSAANVTNGRFNTTVPIFTSESSDSLLTSTDKKLITNEPLVISENDDAVLNVTNEHLNTIVPLVSLENPDAVLNLNESINTTASLAISVSSDALLNVTNEPLNNTAPFVNSENFDALSTTEPLVTSENADVLLNEKEPLNTTVPLAATKNSEVLLHANKPFNTALNVTSEPLNTTVPLVTSENADAVLNDSKEPLNTTVPLVTSENADVLLNGKEPLNTTVPLAATKNSEVLLHANKPFNTALNVTSEPLNTTVPLVTSENADAVLNDSKEPLNTTVPLVTSMNADAVINVTSEPLNTTVPLVTSENADAVLNDSNELLNTTVPLVTSENSDAVLKVTNEPLNTTVPLPSLEASEDALLNEKEPLNTTVPLAYSENADAVSNEPLNTNVPLVTSENAVAVLNDSNELLNTTVPLVTSENSDVVLNISNEPLNTTVPLPCLEVNALLNENEPLNTTVPLVTSINADAVINVTSELLNATVPLVTSENADAVLNDSNEILNTTVPLVTSENSDAVLNVTNEPLNTTVPLPSLEASEDALLNEKEPLNTTVPLVTSENSDAVLNISNEPLNTTVPLPSLEASEDALLNEKELLNTTVPLVTSENSDAVLNISNEPLNTTVPLPCLEVNALLNENEPLNTTAPMVTSINADAVLNVTNEAFNTTVPLPSSEHSVEIGPLDTTVPLVTSENADALFNITNEPLNTTVPLPSLEAFEDALSNESEPLNTTVPLVSSKSSDALFNVTNEPLHTTLESVVGLANLTTKQLNTSAALDSSETPDVLFSTTNKTMNVTYESSNSTISSDADIIELDVSAMTGSSHVYVNVEPENSTVLINYTAENADALLMNDTNMILNDTTVSLLANTEISESCKVVLTKNDGALKSTVPLVVISENTEKRECATSETTDSAGKTVGVAALSDIEEVANTAEISLNNIDPVHATDVSENLNSPMPALESKDAVSCEIVSNIFNKSVTDIDHATINLSSEASNTTLPLTIETKSVLNITNDNINATVSAATADSGDLVEKILNTTNDGSECSNSSIKLNITNQHGNTSDNSNTTEKLLNTTYPETDLTEITDTFLNVTNEQVNTTVSLLDTSENREVVDVSLVKSIHEIVDITQKADGDNAELNVTYDPIKTTVSATSSLADHESNVPLNSSLPTVILEHIAGTDTGLNVTSAPLVATLESMNKSINPIASDVSSESKDLVKPILNITDEPINTIPTAASDYADSPSVTLNITSGSTNSVSVTSDLTCIVEPVSRVASEPLKIPASESEGQSINPLVFVTLDGADSSNNELNNSNKLSKSNTNTCHVEEPNASISLGGTNNVENILNISSFSIDVRVPQVSSESEKNIDDILNISNLQFVEAVAESTFVGNRFENVRTVPEILNISNTEVTYVESTENSQDSLDVFLTTSKSRLNTDFLKNIEEPAPNRIIKDIHVEQLEDTDITPETKTDGTQKPLEYIKETLVPSNVIVGEPSLDSPVVQSEDVTINKKNVSIDFDQCLDDFENGVGLGETFNAVALPSLESDECETINDCKTSPEVLYFNTEALGEFLKENKRHILTPISESCENSMLANSPDIIKRKIKFGENLLNNSISNRLFSSTFDVSPINVSPLVSQSITPITNSLTNSPIQQEKQLQSTFESVFAPANSSDPNKTNVPDTNCKPFCADFNLNATHTINVDGIGKNLNETQVLIKPSLNETVTLSPFNSLDVTRTINMAEEFTRGCEKNRTLFESTIVLDKIGEVDPNETVLLSGSSEINLENSDDYVINKTVKSQNSNILNNLQFERKPLSSVENNKIKLQNISEILFESNTQENMNGILSGNNKNKNMPVCVLKERSENIPENTMGAWFSSLDKNAMKPPLKTEILDNFENPVFSNAADLDIFNTDFQPPSEITGRDSLYLKFDPLYSTPNNNDQTIFVTPLIKSEATIDTHDVNNENSLEQLKAEVARLHELLKQQENVATEKLNYLKIRNEEVNVRCLIEQEKLDKLERNEKKLVEELKNRESTSQQMNALAVSYNEIISNVEKDLQKLKDEQVDASAVKSELESSKHHLKSAEDAFMDVLAKYEKISATVPDLRAINEQKKKKICELQRESLRIDERVRYSESTLAAEMEEIRRTSKLNNDQFAIETSRLTAQLRKTELTHKNTKDTFDNIIVENEKLANLCDDIIAGKS